VRSVSRFAEKVRRWYDTGIWDERMVRNAYEKGRITEAEMNEILGE